MILKLAYTPFKEPDFLAVGEAGRRDEHARRANAADRIASKKPRESDGSQYWAERHAEGSHPSRIAMHVGFHGEPKVLAHLPKRPIPDLRVSGAKEPCALRERFLESIELQFAA